MRLVAKSFAPKWVPAHHEPAAPSLKFLRSCDELVVLCLDRLGRSTRDVLNLVHELEEKGASLRMLELTVGSMGKMVITILGMPPTWS